jgi:hypothetical protein
MIPRRDSDGCDVNDDMYGSVCTRIIDIYTYGFRTKKTIALITSMRFWWTNVCVCENIDTILHNVPFFPNKVSHKFTECSSTGFVKVLKTYLMITDNYTDSVGHTAVSLAGVEVK